jgi:hypothetical protein
MYCTKPDEFTGYCITFYKNGTFEEDSWGCMGAEFGKGRYLISNDSMYLYYNLVDTSANVIFLKEQNCIDSSYYEINIQVYSENINDISHCYFVLKDSLEIIDSKECSIDGKCKLKCKKANRRYILALKSLGRLISESYVKVNNCSDIKFEIKKVLFYRFIESNTTIKRKIVKLNKRYLSLETNNTILNLLRYHKIK